MTGALFKRAGPSESQRIGDWLRFEADGTVSVFSGKVELGQGIATALAQIVAEELDIAIERVRMVPANTASSPNEGVTSGSLSIQDSGGTLRLACATVRALAEGADYHDCASAAFYAEPILANALLKSVADYRLVGRSAPRLDIARKLTGQPSFIQDLALPGMLHGRVIQPPQSGAILEACDERDVARLDGVVAVVRDGSFLGVVATREDGAIHAMKALAERCRWQAGPPLPDEAAIHEALQARAAPPVMISEHSDPSQAARGARSFAASYTRPYTAHASIGPSCAVAQMTDDGMRVWSHSQGIFNLRRDLAMALRLAESQVIVQHMEGAGCYGHNGADDVALDAALLARAAHGAPVRVQWMREDEFALEPYGPAMRMDLQASVDASGTVVDWQHALWSNGHSMRPGRADSCGLLASWRLEQAFAPPPALNAPLPSGGAERNAIPLYEFANQRILNHFVAETPLRVSALRSLGGFANVFAIESFMDEIAAALKIDPIAFRLRHLRDARAIAVLEAAAERAGWGDWTAPKGEGRGHGVAVSRYKNLGAYCAVVAEIEAEREVRVSRLAIAVDVGLVINPDGVKNQIEGGALQATSMALKEQVRFNAAGITSRGWESYPILRFSEAPQVDVVLLARPELPALGAGEASVGPCAAAIANATAHALGVRVRKLPLSAENIVAAML